MRIPAKPPLVPLAVLALLACACGSSRQSSGTTPTGKPFRITLIAGTTADNFYATMNCGAKAEASKLGVDYSFTGPNHFDAQQQIPIVNTVTAQHPDAVLIAPTDVSALIQPMQAMKAAAIKVVEVDTTVKDNTIAVSQVSSDNLAGGKLAADTLAQLIGARGTVMVINVNPGISTTDARDQGFHQQMSAKYPNIKVLATQYDNDDQAKASQILTSTYAAHPDLSGIFAANTISAEGAATGIRNAGATGKIFSVGFDAEPQSVQDLHNGVVQALIAQEPAQIGASGIDQAVAALEGKPVQAHVGTGLVAITKANESSNTQYFYKSSC
jgi:ribose transport system substrate-binding protein